jgi:hypothetical protein
MTKRPEAARSPACRRPEPAGFESDAVNCCGAAQNASDDARPTWPCERFARFGERMAFSPVVQLLPRRGSRSDTLTTRDVQLQKSRSKMTITPPVTSCSALVFAPLREHGLGSALGLAAPRGSRPGGATGAGVRVSRARREFPPRALLGLGWGGARRGTERQPTSRLRFRDALLRCGGQPHTTRNRIRHFAIRRSPKRLNIGSTRTCAIRAHVWKLVTKATVVEICLN